MESIALISITYLGSKLSTASLSLEAAYFVFSEQVVLKGRDRIYRASSSSLSSMVLKLKFIKWLCKQCSVLEETTPILTSV